VKRQERNVCKMSGPTSVISLRDSQTEDLTDVLSRVFCDRLPFTYLIRERHERRIMLAAFFSSAISASELYGETYSTPDVEGGALWIGPGRSIAIQRLLRAASAPTPSRVSWASLKRSLALAAGREEIRQRIAKQPHWYLVALGATPSKEEAALRSALLERMLSRAAADGVPCYLDTFDETDLSFYEQHGFRILGGGRLPDHGPNFWAMMRPSRSSQMHGTRFTGARGQ